MEPLLISEALGVEFLDASDAVSAGAWLKLWHEWPGREVSAHPAYVKLFARPTDRVVCAAARTSEGGILYPVIVRSIRDEPWSDREERGCDLTNAYGYGGPYAWNVSESEARDFWARFDVWARGLGAVTSFARLSPFADQVLAFHGETRDRGPVVARSLDPSPDEIWSDYDGKVRRNVLRARREGLEVTFDPRGERLDSFLAVYESTMDRRQAQEQYYFPRSFFESIIAELPGQFLFAHVLSKGKVVSSDLMLLSEKRAYYFLGGTLAEAFPMRPNDLLKHETFLRCRELGKKQVLLGGGYGTDDGLLRYKRSFAPTGERPFCVGTMTYDAPESARLVERCREWERGQGREWAPVDGFFPAYRS
jgi:hypothetical protein